jgi:hypothetical protein
MRIWPRKRPNCADLHEHVFEFSAILSNDIGIETAQLHARVVYSLIGCTGKLTTRIRPLLFFSINEESKAETDLLC